MSSPDLHWSAVTEAFLRWTGMRLPVTMQVSVSSLLEQRAKEHRCSVQGYLQKCEDDAPLRQVVLDDIGLGSTWFMRDEPGLRTLMKALRNDTSRDRTVWVWSAGCSSGEEAYTLAMALADEGMTARVLGTDLNRLALERARAGVYSRRSLRHVPKAWLWRYFDQVGDQYQVKPEVRRAVNFELHNLVDGRFPPSGWFRFDAIVCRNVLLYFDQPEALAIISAMAKACRKQGYILLGAIERPIFWMSDLVERDRAAELVQVVPGKTSDDVAFVPVAEIIKHSTQALKAYSGGVSRSDVILHDTPTGAAELLDRANLAQEAGRLADALRLIDEAIVDAPLSAPAHLARGLVLKHLNRLEEAVRSLRSSRFLAADHWLAPYQLAICLDALEQPEDAQEAYKHAFAVLTAKGASGLHRSSLDVDMMQQTAMEVCQQRIAGAK